MAVKFDRKEFGKQSKLLENAFDRVKREIDSLGISEDASDTIYEILGKEHMVLIGRLTKGEYTAPVKRKPKPTTED